MTLGGHLSCNLSCRIDLSSPSRVTTTLAGSGKHDHRDGVGTDASFDYPGGLGLGPDGVIYVGDYQVPPRTTQLYIIIMRAGQPYLAAHNATTS